MLRDIKADVAPLTANDYGQVSPQGSLSAFGSLARVRNGESIVYDGRDPRDFGWADASVELLDMQDTFIGVACFDNAADVAMGREYICLQVFEIEVKFRPVAPANRDMLFEGPSSWALVLESLAADNVFRRVGLCRIYSKIFPHEKTKVTIF
jgi:hypothetical protein